MTYDFLKITHIWYLGFRILYCEYNINFIFNLIWVDTELVRDQFRDLGVNDEHTSCLISLFKFVVIFWGYVAKI